MRLLLAAALVLSALIPSATYAQDESLIIRTGNDYQRVCANSERVPDGLVCLNETDGVFAGTQASDFLHHVKTVCLPSGVTTNQLRDIGLQAIQAHPETAQLQFGILLIRSWRGAYPCNDTPRPMTIRTGVDLVKMCSTPDESSQAACTFYISGTRDAGSVAEAASGKALMCVPEAETYGQLQEIGLRSIRQHPETSSYEAALLLFSSWRTAFPCSSSKLSK